MSHITVMSVLNPSDLDVYFISEKSRIKLSIDSLNAQRQLYNGLTRLPVVSNLYQFRNNRRSAWQKCLYNITPSNSTMKLTMLYIERVELEMSYQLIRLADEMEALNDMLSNSVLNPTFAKAQEALNILSCKIKHIAVLMQKTLDYIKKNSVEPLQSKMKSSLTYLNKLNTSLVNCIKDLQLFSNIFTNNSSRPGI